MNKLLVKNKKFITRQWLMLIYVFIFQLGSAFIARSIAPLSVVVGNDLHLTSIEIGYFPAALFLGQSLISIPSGYLADRVHTRHMFYSIIAVLTCSFMIMAQLHTTIGIFICIVFAGFAYGATHPATNYSILHWFPQERRGIAMGLKQVAVTLGSMFGALLLLPLASSFGWRKTFMFVALCFLIITVIVTNRYRERHVHDKNSLSKNVFAIRQYKSLFRNERLFVITFVAFLLSGVQMIVNTFIVVYAIDYLHVSIFLAGTLLVLAEIGGSVGRLIWGIVSDNIFKSNRIVVLIIISIFVSVISLLIAYLPKNIPFILVASIVFILGIHSNGFNGIWMNAT